MKAQFKLSSFTLEDTLVDLETCGQIIIRSTDEEMHALLNVEDIDEFCMLLQRMKSQHETAH